jgi:hypothetical protein
MTIFASSLTTALSGVTISNLIVPAILTPLI